jgi:uncharacterized protein
MDLTGKTVTGQTITETKIIDSLRSKFARQFYIERHSNKFLLINPENSSWAIVNKDTYDLLGNASFSQSEKLIVGGIRSALRVDESSCKSFTQNRNKKIGLAVLHTTNGCNLACRYCYAFSDSKKIMTPDVSKRVVDRIREYDSFPFHLEFHGGEPVSRMPLIQETMEYISAQGLQEKLNVTIQTNATLITPDIAKFFKRHNIHVGVSIDGPAEVHNRNRVYPDGIGSFSNTLRGVRYLQEEGVNIGVCSVLTDPEDLRCYPKFADEIGIGSIKFGPYFSSQGRSELETPDDFREKYPIEMLALMDRIVESKSKLKVRNLSNLLKNIITPSRNYMCMRFPCGAGSSMMGIGTDGEAYPCEEMNGKQNLIVGNIFEKDFDQLYQNPINHGLRNRDISGLEDCAACHSKNICSVTCANKSYNESEGFNTKDSNCEYYKTIIPELMWRVYESPQETQNLI